MADVVAGILLVLIILAGLFLAISWILLPFAVFGLQRRADKVLAELKGIATQLSMLQGRIDQISRSQAGESVRLRAVLMKAHGVTEDQIDRVIGLDDLDGSDRADPIA